MLLIETFRTHKDRFSNPRIQKKAIWDDIAEEMQRRGHAVSGTGCDRKWRNMRASYKNIVNNSKKRGRGKKVWRYLEYLDEIYANDVSILTVVPQAPEEQCPSQSASTAASKTADRVCPAPQCTASEGSSDCVSPVEFDTDVSLLGSTTLSSAQHKETRKRRSEAPDWFIEHAKASEDWRSDMRSMMTEFLAEQRRKNDLLEMLLQTLQKD